MELKMKKTKFKPIDSKDLKKILKILKKSDDMDGVPSGINGFHALVYQALMETPSIIHPIMSAIFHASPLIVPFIHHSGFIGPEIPTDYIKAIAQYVLSIGKMLEIREDRETDKSKH